MFSLIRWWQLVFVGVEKKSTVITITYVHNKSCLCFYWWHYNGVMWIEGLTLGGGRMSRAPALSSSSCSWEIGEHASKSVCPRSCKYWNRGEFYTEKAREREKEKDRSWIRCLSQETIGSALCKRKSFSHSIASCPPLLPQNHPSLLFQQPFPNSPSFHTGHQIDTRTSYSPDRDREISSDTL